MVESKHAAASDLSVSLAESIGGGGLLTVYGVPVTGLEFDAAALPESGVSAEFNSAVQVKGFRVGPRYCMVLPRPALFFLPGTGTPLDEDECGFKKSEVRKWHSLSLESRAIALEPSQGELGELLEEFSLRGISGDIDVTTRYENGNVCIDVRVWAEIKVFGRGVKFDKTLSHCVSLAEACFPIPGLNLGWASVEGCLRLPNQLCIKLRVGKFGLEKTWEKCTTIPVPRNLSVQAGDCDCND